MKNKVHEFITALDEAKYGHRITEDTAPVATAPSHAPTSTAQWKTPSKGKSDDQGARTGSEKDAIKKSSSAIPAPVAPAPSHAPTSTAQWKTKDGGNNDEGEKVNKEAMKEELMQKIIDAEDFNDIEAIMAEADLSEGGHKPGCQCGFCKNKGKFGKKAEGEAEKEDDKATMGEAMRRPPMGRHGFGGPARPGSTIRGKIGSPMRLGGGGGGHMSFRHPAARPPRPKATSLPGGAINPNQPAMERLDTSSNSKKTIQEIADQYLEAPEFE